MATKTTNYGLTKPEGSDFYDIGVQNDNMDIIDKQMKANAKDIAQLNSDFTFDERSVSSGGLFVQKNKDVVIVSSYFSGNFKGGNTNNIVSLPDGVNFTTSLFAPCEVLDTNWTPVGNSGYISVNRNQLTIRCKETMNGVVIANLVAPAAYVQFN